MFFDLFRYLYINACFHAITFQIVFLGSESAADVFAFSFSIDTFHLICLFSLYRNISHAQIKLLFLENCCAMKAFFKLATPLPTLPRQAIDDTVSNLIGLVVEPKASYTGSDELTTEQVAG